MSITPKVGDMIYYQLADSSRAYFNEGIIMGETSRSWLVGRATDWWIDHAHMFIKHAKKVPKTGTTFVSKEFADGQRWLAEHRYHIGRCVQQIEDGQLLRKIAELISYQPETKL